MAENFSNLMKAMNINIQGAQQTPSKMKLQTHIETHNQTLKRQRQQNLKAANHTSSPIRLSADFLSEIVEVIGQWANIFKVLKNTINQDSYIQQDYSSKMRGKSRHFQRIKAEMVYDH